MTSIAWWVLAIFPVLVVYSYLLYPLALRLLAAFTRPSLPVGEPAEWPTISVTVPVHNEEAQLPGLIESLLALDYPVERRQILIVSDASTDRTDEIVRAYAERGVELLRMPTRGGKTKAENAAGELLRGEIVVNTDASIRIEPSALKRLIAVFSDPSIGAASGRDVSVAREGGRANAGEAGYVGYEMRVRSLETRVAGIVGASGCFYAIRSHLHRVPLPEWLSRDFAAAMIAARHGYRAVSVDAAVCFVPRTTSLAREYRRKVRTMSRGMQTMHHMRHLLNPVRYGWFAWMLFSHKICRWAVPWSGVGFLAGLALLSPTTPWAAWGTAACLVGLLGCSLAWLAAREQPRASAVTLAAYLLAGNVAALHATIDALRGDRMATWEPTRRTAVHATAGRTG